MTAAKDQSLARQLRLATLIQQQYKAHPDTLRVSIKLETLKTDQSLKDLDGVQRALRKMEKDLQPDFEFDALTHRFPQSVTDTDPSRWPEALIGYSVVLEDKAALARYILDMQQQLRESEQYQFVLAHPKKHEAALSLEGSTKSPYIMRTHARRYKLLRHLAEKKTAVTTQDLADFLSTDEPGVTADDVRGTVEEIRTQVSNKFAIPRSSLIQNDRSGSGYVVDNVRII